MNLLLLLAALYLGTALATPKFDQTVAPVAVNTQKTIGHEWGRMEESSVGEHENDPAAQWGLHGFSMEMDAFGDMTNEEFR